MLTRPVRQAHARVAWWMLILAAIACSRVPSLARLEPDELESASVSNGADRSTMVADLSINPVQPGDDLLFFAYNIEPPILVGVGIQLYSGDSGAGRYACLTCDMDGDEGISTLAVFLPASLSRERRTLAARAGFFAADETVSRGGVWLIDIGSGEVRVVGEAIFVHVREVSLSADATRVAVTTDDGAIFVMDAESEEILLETRNPPLADDPSQFARAAHVEGYFSWSLDGSHLLYDSEDGQIVSVDVDQGTASILRPAEPVTDYDYPVFAFAAWAPDGRRVLFVSDVDKRSTGATASEMYSGVDWTSGGDLPVDALDLYVMNSDGGGQVCLTCDSNHSPSWAFTPTWSPDGSKVAFFDYDFTELPQWHEEVMVAAADGSELRSLARFPTQDIPLMTLVKTSGPPVWSPDGTQLAFSAQNGDNYAVFVVDEDGANLRLVAAEPGRDFVYPIWLGNQLR
jgi:Tol biopolymer transport system component